MHHVKRSHFLASKSAFSKQAGALTRTLIAAAILAAAAALCFLVLIPKTQSNSERTALPKPVAAPRPDINALTEKAAQGEAAAMNALGRAYVKGDGVKTDYKKAAELFQKAADLGNADAQVNLAKLYDVGQGVPLNNAEALKLFKQAAEQNHPGAAYNLGNIYGSARGVPENIPESTKWYMKSAELGDEFAQYNVAQRYHLGVGVGVDLVEAYKWYELSARKGVPDAAEARDKLKRTLSRQQIEEATSRIDKWKPAGG